jgi:hypothetical protein
VLVRVDEEASCGFICITFANTNIHYTRGSGLAEHISVIGGAGFTGLAVLREILVRGHGPRGLQRVEVSPFNLGGGPAKAVWLRRRLDLVGGEA